MAKSSKKRAKQCNLRVAKGSDVKLRGQVRGQSNAGYWLGDLMVLLKVIMTLESLWMHVRPWVCHVM